MCHGALQPTKRRRVQARQSGRLKLSTQTYFLMPRCNLAKRPGARFGLTGFEPPTPPMVDFPECHDGLPPHIETFLHQRIVAFEVLAPLAPEEERARFRRIADCCRRLLELYKPMLVPRDDPGSAFP